MEPVGEMVCEGVEEEEPLVETDGDSDGVGEPDDELDRETELVSVDETVGLAEKEVVGEPVCEGELDAELVTEPVTD